MEHEKLISHLQAVILAYRSNYLLDVKIQLAESFLKNLEEKPLKEPDGITPYQYRKLVMGDWENEPYVPSEARPLDSDTRRENSRIANEVISFEETKVGYPSGAYYKPVPEHLKDLAEFIEKEMTAKVDAELKKRSDARLRSSILRKTNRK